MDSDLSNSNGTASDDHVEVARLRQRYERERSIRLEAEAIAEKHIRELYTKQQELTLLQRIAFAANEADDVDSILQTAIELVCEYLDWPIGHVYVWSTATRKLCPTPLWHIRVPTSFLPFQTATEESLFSPGEGLPGTVYQTGEPQWLADISNARNFPRMESAISLGILSGFAMPVLHGGSVVSVLEFFDQKVRAREDAIVEISRHIATQLSRVVERCHARSQSHLQFDRLTALHAIDTAITDGRDLPDTLFLCIDQAARVLKAEGAAVLLYDLESDALHCAAHNGYSQSGFSISANGKLSSNTTAARRVISTRSRVHQSTRGDDGLHRDYHGVPLIAHGEIKGVLELYGCDPERADKSWFAFVETLAGQIAVAIDNGALVENLKVNNLELTVAYDATIEGWSRALDLRDKETEGHSRRVTEMTILLAESVGYEGDMVGMRRGALLHDIGKMGVPDAILLKPGSLTDEEWVIMRRHPEYAYDMLCPIVFLADALDIPYCHHEKWDGTGYPRGLKGDEIPLAARIFAIVDVWDALSSDRPYRNAWPADRVIDHIRDLSGSHFDPDIVETFLNLLQSRLHSRLDRAA